MTNTRDLIPEKIAYLQRKADDLVFKTFWSPKSIKTKTKIPLVCHPLRYKTQVQVSQFYLTYDFFKAGKKLCISLFSSYESKL